MGALRNALSAEDPRVRMGALKVVSELWLWELGPEMIALLEDPELDLRARAAGTVSWLEIREAPLKLVVRRAAAETLAGLGDAESLPDLRKRLRDEDLDVRLAAVAALGRLGSREAIPAFLRLLRREAQGGRANGEAAGALGAREAIWDLPRLLTERLEEDAPPQELVVALGRAWSRRKRRRPSSTSLGEATGSPGGGDAPSRSSAAREARPASAAAQANCTRRAARRCGSWRR